LCGTDTLLFATGESADGAIRESLRVNFINGTLYYCAIPPPGGEAGAAPLMAINT